MKTVRFAGYPADHKFLSACACCACLLSRRVTAFSEDGSVVAVSSPGGDSNDRDRYLLRNQRSAVNNDAWLHADAPPPVEPAANVPRGDPAPARRGPLAWLATLGGMIFIGLYYVTMGIVDADRINTEGDE